MQVGLLHWPGGGSRAVSAVIRKRKSQHGETGREKGKCGYPWRKRPGRPPRGSRSPAASHSHHTAVLRTQGSPEQPRTVSMRSQGEGRDKEKENTPSTPLEAWEGKGDRLGRPVQGHNQQDPTAAPAWQGKGRRRRQTPRAKNNSTIASCAPPYTVQESHRRLKARRRPSTGSLLSKKEMAKRKIKVGQDTARRAFVHEKKMQKQRAAKVLFEPAWPPRRLPSLPPCLIRQPAHAAQASKPLS